MHISWKPSRPALAGIIVGIAATAGTLVGVAVANTGDTPANLPTGEVQVGTPTVPDRTKSRPLTRADIGAGIDVGRFRVLASGDDRTDKWAEDMVGVQPAGSPRFVALGLQGHKLTPPAPFALESHELGVVVGEDGKARLQNESFTLTSDTYRRVFIEVIRVRPGALVEINPANDNQQASSVYDANGTPVIIEHGAASATLQPVLRAHMVIGDFYLMIDSVPLPVDVMTALVDALVEQN